MFNKSVENSDLTFFGSLLSISSDIYEPIECPTFMENLDINYHEFNFRNQKSTATILEINHFTEI